MSTKFIDKSVIIALILDVKNKYFEEQFVDFRELNYITNFLQNYFNKSNLNAIINDKIDENIFQVNDVIVLNRSNNIPINEISKYYEGYYSHDFANILFDEMLILEEFMKFKTSIIEKAQNKKEGKILELKLSNRQ